MSYTTKIKNEISLTIKQYKPIEKKVQLSGFIRNNIKFNNKDIILTTENINITKLINDFINDLYEVQVEITIVENLNFSKKELYQIKISKKTKEILKDIGYLDENNNYSSTPKNEILEDNLLIKSYLKGAFLCTGSINDPEKSRYHMEMLISTPEEAVFIQKLLNIFDLNAKILNRDKGYMIYIKEAEKISDFIKILGATNAVLYYENIRVYRDEKNITNRLNNCEQANIDKIISNASKQLEDIKVLEEEISLDLLDEKCLIVAKERKNNPEASLKELAEIISEKTKKKLTKSGLNHRFRKIKELADKIRKNKEEV